MKLYLIGFTIVNGSKTKPKLFKQLRIPFKSEKEIEKFRVKMERRINPGFDFSNLVTGDKFKIKWVDFITTRSKKSALYIGDVN